MTTETRAGGDAWRIIGGAAVAPRSEGEMHAAFSAGYGHSVHSRLLPRGARDEDLEWTPDRAYAVTRGSQSRLEIGGPNHRRDHESSSDCIICATAGRQLRLD